MKTLFVISSIYLILFAFFEIRKHKDIKILNRHPNLTRLLFAIILTFDAVILMYLIIKYLP
jgi:hypothetical protein